MVIGMVVLLVFARLTRTNNQRTQAAATVLLWFSVLLFCLTGLCIFTSVFFQHPINLSHWIVGGAPSPVSPLPLITDLDKVIDLVLEDPELASKTYSGHPIDCAFSEGYDTSKKTLTRKKEEIWHVEIMPDARRYMITKGVTVEPIEVSQNFAAKAKPLVVPAYQSLRVRGEIHVYSRKIQILSAVLSFE
jgi:hypothetical protein